MNARTVSNYVWSIVVLAMIITAAYFLLPIIGKWMSDGMGGRDTMDRPSSMDVRDGLPSK